MGNWLHLLYDPEKGVLWRNILPVAVLVIIFSFLWGAVAGVGGLSVSTIWKSLSWNQNQTSIIEPTTKTGTLQQPLLGPATKLAEEKARADAAAAADVAKKVAEAKKKAELSQPAVIARTPPQYVPPQPQYVPPPSSPQPARQQAATPGTYNLSQGQELILSDMRVTVLEGTIIVKANRNDEYGRLMQSGQTLSFLAGIVGGGPARVQLALQPQPNQPQYPPTIPQQSLTREPRNACESRGGLIVDGVCKPDPNTTCIMGAGPNNTNKCYPRLSAQQPPLENKMPSSGSCNPGSVFSTALQRCVHQY